LKSADYTTIWRRIRATEFEIEQSEAKNELELKGAIVAIDATGMKVTNRGEWMREKWKKKRGWIKDPEWKKNRTRSSRWRSRQQRQFQLSKGKGHQKWYQSEKKCLNSCQRISV
jgi:hypothetical protein